MIYELVIGSLLCGVVLTAKIALDIQRLRRSSSHTLKTLCQQYMVQFFLQLLGRFMFQRLQQDSKRCHKVQEKFLRVVLKRNSSTEYGMKYKFSQITSRDKFIQLHPLTRYSHYQEYVDKIARGDDKVLTSKKPIILAVTSGTSGKSHIIPSTQETSTTFFLNGITVMCHCMVTTFPNVCQLQKVLKFFYTPRHRQSEGGIPIGPNSSSPKNTGNSMLSVYTTPVAGYEIMTEPEALYIHLLFALRDRNLGALEANFASLIHNGFLLLRQNWRHLVDDIRFGRVNSTLSIPEEVRTQLDSLLKPNPKRAKELEEEFTVGFEGIAKRLWPHLNIVLTCDTGSMDIYGKILKNVYTKGVNHYSPLYAATEGLLGVNIWPEDSHSVYVLIPKSMFYEFIPIDESDQDQPKTLFTDQVEKGDTYELVITNTSGLYRYRLGDVVRVIRFHYQAPVVEFLYRQGQLLNVRGEKVSEKVFYDSLTEASLLWKGSKIVDYCCAESSSLDLLPESSRKHMQEVPHYLVFLEFEDGTHLSEEKRNLLDATLRKNHQVYESFRNKGSIGPLRIIEVRRASFLDLRKLILATSEASPNQLKVPRVLRTEAVLQFMLDRAERS